MQAGLPWFDYYDADAKDFLAWSIPSSVKTVVAKLGGEGQPFTPVDPGTVITLKDPLHKKVSDGTWQLPCASRERPELGASSAGLRVGTCHGTRRPGAA